MKVCFPRARRRYEMGRRLHTTASGTTPEFEDAMILDETTATYAAAFAAVCAGLGGSAAAPGDEHVALRLAQQMRTAAAAYWAGKRLDEEVWVPKGAREQ